MFKAKVVNAELAGTPVKNFGSTRFGIASARPKGADSALRLVFVKLTGHPSSWGLNFVEYSADAYCKILEHDTLS